jgi:Domain of unknown function (DUF1816)
MQQFSTDWWAEIITATPHCIYFFGPFQSSEEAEDAYPGYIEDLDGEGAQGIAVAIKRCEPMALTICNEEET